MIRAFGTRAGRHRDSDPRRLRSRRPGPRAPRRRRRPSPPPQPRHGVGAALALLLLALAAPAGAVTIDTFTTNQAALSDPAASNLGDRRRRRSIGTRRGMVLDLLTGAGPTTASVAGRQSRAAPSPPRPPTRAARSRRFLGRRHQSPRALAHRPEQCRSHHRQRHRLPARLRLDDRRDRDRDHGLRRRAPNFSRAVRRVAVGGVQSVRIPFAEFRIAGGAGADFASVGAIEMTVRGGEGTVDPQRGHHHRADRRRDQGGQQSRRRRRRHPGRSGRSRALHGDGHQHRQPGARRRSLTDTVDANTHARRRFGLLDAGGAQRPVRLVRQRHLRDRRLGREARPPRQRRRTPTATPSTVQSGTFPATSAQGGTVTLISAATGEFTYIPPAGFAGVDSLQLHDPRRQRQHLDRDGVHPLEGVVWFVDELEHDGAVPRHAGRSVPDPAGSAETPTSRAT